MATIVEETTAPAVSPLDHGLPRAGSYSIIDVTVTEAVLARIELRTYLLDERLPGGRYLFLGLTTPRGTSRIMAGGSGRG